MADTPAMTKAMMTAGLGGGGACVGVGVGVGSGAGACEALGWGAGRAAQKQAVPGARWLQPLVGPRLPARGRAHPAISAAAWPVDTKMPAERNVQEGGGCTSEARVVGAPWRCEGPARGHDQAQPATRRRAARAGLTRADDEADAHEAAGGGRRRGGRRARFAGAGRAPGPGSSRTLPPARRPGPEALPSPCAAPRAGPRAAHATPPPHPTLNQLSVRGSGVLSGASSSVSIGEICGGRAARAGVCGRAPNPAEHGAAPERAAPRPSTRHPPPLLTTRRLISRYAARRESR
jgi:hypothetical protein